MAHRMAAQRLRHHRHHGGVVQHADLDGVGTNVAQHGVDLARQKLGRQRVDAAHAQGVLRGDGGDGGGAKAAQRGNGFQVGLNARAATRVGARDGQHAGHGEARCWFVCRFGTRLRLGRTGRQRAVHQAAQHLRCVLGVGCVADGAHHGHAVGAGGHHLGQAAGVHAANGHQWQSGVLARPAQARQPQRLGGVALGGSGKHRADGQVVHRLYPRQLQLVQLLNRPAQPHVGGHQPPRIGGHQVALAQVQARGVHRQGHVQPVVDDQRHAVRGQQCFERMAPAHQLAGAGGFAAQLHAAHATAHRGLHLLQPGGFQHTRGVGHPIQRQLGAQVVWLHAWPSCRLRVARKSASLSWSTASSKATA